MRRACWMGCVLLLVACGGEEQEASGGQAGPCNPEGLWLVTYTSDTSTLPSENLDVGAAGGTSSVDFPDREPPRDQCMPDAGPGTATLGADFDEPSCTLEASWSTSYCRSGEQQCESFTLTLRFAGDSASGTAVRDGGWCMDTYSSEYTASAQRVVR